MLGAQATGPGGRGQAHRRPGHGDPGGPDRHRPGRPGTGLLPAVRGGQGPGQPGWLRGRQRARRRPRRVARHRPGPRWNPPGCWWMSGQPRNTPAGTSPAHSTSRTPSCASASGRSPAARTVLVYCASGFRSYLALRVLRQRGWDDVRSLSGGPGHAAPGSPRAGPGKRGSPAASWCAPGPSLGSPAYPNALPWRCWHLGTAAAGTAVLSTGLWRFRFDAGGEGSAGRWWQRDLPGRTGDGRPGQLQRPGDRGGGARARGRVRLVPARGPGARHVAGPADRPALRRGHPPRRAVGRGHPGR